MNKALEKQLIDEFPTFFRDMYGDPKKTCMSWGCDFGDGWFNLLHALCKKLKLESDDNFHFTQIKEKFGLMRIYSSGGNERTSILLDEYEELSAFVCETCGGDDATTKGQGWIQTLCDDCRNKKPSN